MREKDRADAGRLEAAGWQSRVDINHGVRTISWLSPADGCWYVQEDAVEHLEGSLPVEAGAGAAVKRGEDDERRELEEAGWEPRGEGPKAIWRRPEGGRWYVHYQALAMLREERLSEQLDALENPPTPGGGAE